MASPPASRAVIPPCSPACRPLVVHLPPCLTRRLHVALGGLVSLLARQRTDGLKSDAGSAEIGALVVDPAQFIGAGIPASLLADASLMRVPIVLYTHNTQESAPLCFAWARAGAGHLFLADVDDDAGRLRDVFNALLHGKIAGGLDKRLAELPPSLGRALQGMLEDRTPVLSMDALAACANMTRRSVIRCLQRERLAPPKRFLSAARLIRTHRILAAGERNLAIAATRAGFSSERALRHSARVLLQAGPAALRILSVDDLHRRVADRLREA